jgi:hypothetical protein
MKIVKVSIEDNDGRVAILKEGGLFSIIEFEILRGNTKDISWTTDIRTLQNKYYSMLPKILDRVESSATKDELHKFLKAEILPMLIDFPQYFIDNIPTTETTSTLNVAGWDAYMANLRDACIKLFGCEIFN